MRILLALFLIAMMCMISFKELVFVGAYQVNKEYIAKNLCEERTIPKSDCDGKCFFSKKIQEANQQQEVPTGTMPQMTQEKVNFFYQEENLLMVTINPTNTLSNGLYLMKYSQSFHQAIDHPPNA